MDMSTPPSRHKRTAESPRNLTTRKKSKKRHRSQGDDISTSPSPSNKRQKRTSAVAAAAGGDSFEYILLQQRSASPRRASTPRQDDDEEEEEEGLSEDDDWSGDNPFDAPAPAPLAEAQQQQPPPAPAVPTHYNADETRTNIERRINEFQSHWELGPEEERLDISRRNGIEVAPHLDSAADAKEWMMRHMGLYTRIVKFLREYRPNNLVAVPPQAMPASRPRVMPPNVTLAPEIEAVAVKPTVDLIGKNAMLLKTLSRYQAELMHCEGLVNLYEYHEAPGAAPAGFRDNPISHMCLLWRNQLDALKGLAMMAFEVLRFDVLHIEWSVNHEFQSSAMNTHTKTGMIEELMISLRLSPAQRLMRAFGRYCSIQKWARVKAEDKWDKAFIYERVHTPSHPITNRSYFTRTFRPRREIRQELADYCQRDKIAQTLRTSDSRVEIRVIAELIGVEHPDLPCVKRNPLAYAYNNGIFFIASPKPADRDVEEDDCYDVARPPYFHFYERALIPREVVEDAETRARASGRAVESFLPPYGEDKLEQDGIDATMHTREIFDYNALLGHAYWALTQEHAKTFPTSGSNSAAQKRDAKFFETLALNIPTPEFDKLLRAQGFDAQSDPAMYTFFLGSHGRLLCAKLDGQQFAIMHVGKSGAGKSTCANIVTKLMNKKDVRTVGNQTEAGFGLGMLVGKRLIVGRDWDEKCTIDIRNVCSAISHEDMEISHKYDDSTNDTLHGNWMILCNRMCLPPLEEILRRFLVFEWTVTPRLNEKRSDLTWAILKRSSDLLVKLVLAYHWLRTLVGTGDVRSVAPKYFQNSERNVAQKSSPVASFIEDVRQNQIELTPQDEAYRHLQIPQDAQPKELVEYLQRHGRNAYYMTLASFVAAYNAWSDKTKQKNRRGGITERNYNSLASHLQKSYGIHFVQLETSDAEKTIMESLGLETRFRVVLVIGVRKDERRGGVAPVVVVEQ